MLNKNNIPFLLKIPALKEFIIVLDQVFREQIIYFGWQVTRSEMQCMDLRESLASEEEVEIGFDFGLSSFVDHIFYMWGGKRYMCMFGGQKDE